MFIRRTQTRTAPTGETYFTHRVVSRYVSWNPHGNSPVCFVDELPGMTKQSEKRSGPTPSPL